MHFDADSVVPLFQQVAQQLQAGILSGAFQENEQVPSTTAMARQYQLNPATVLKGMNVLVEAGLIEKKRGIGMFVCPGAKAKLQQLAIADFGETLKPVIQAAKALGMDKDALLQAIDKRWDK
ncbi:GntR family transcriptional regulator [Lacticaseibacillus sp. N501-2]|uniref:GntR family transcriptional regulator n=1 Tax=Lacticaseibacillus salsurae TaxID=3367729 RepID=UPI0038B245BE